MAHSCPAPMTLTVGLFGDYAGLYRAGSLGCLANGVSPSTCVPCMTWAVVFLRAGRACDETNQE